MPASRSTARYALIGSFCSTEISVPDAGARQVGLTAHSQIDLLSDLLRPYSHRRFRFHVQKVIAQATSSERRRSQ